MFLNCHTCFSFKFGMIKPEDLLREAAGKGVSKLVVSDINNTSAILDIHRLARKYNVRPVAGIDFRNEAQQKFIGIAKNEEGFRELNEFLSFHLKEEAAFEDRAPEFHHAFIIYPFSNAPHHLHENEFIGIRPGELNRLIFSGIKHLHHKLVILQPVTFREKETREIGDKDRKRKITYELRHLHNGHRLLRAMHNNVVLSKLPQHDQAMPDEIMLRPEELVRLYKDFPHLIYNTEKLLDTCEVIDFKFAEDDDGTEARSSNKNRKYFLTNPSEDYELMMRLCEDGMYRRYPHEDSAIRERFTKEIKIIVEKQFSSYFLINHDIVQYARHKDFFYVGRGSGANSMVAYLLNITDVDPIELDLYFERFINPSRKNPPDFDIDFSWAERDQIIQYIFDKYGDQHTALLGTYSEMKTDSLLRELGKVFGLPKREIDALQNYQENQTADHITRGIWQYAQLLYSFPNHLSIHAGGILISQRPVNYYTALSHPPKGHGLTQFSMQEAEDVGFAKFDILSQRGLGKVRDAVSLIKENKGEDIDIHDVKRCINDEDVRKNLKEAKLMGCFYVESPAMRMLLTKLKASTYLDLVAASSIIRPGVAQSGMMQEYIRRFHETDHGRSRAIPELWNIMEETFGVMVYQEDVIKVAYKFGGFTLEEADKLRRGMGGKYRGRQEFLDVKEKFFANCRRDGKDEKVVNEVWFQMETFGGYAFAKGHSASYAVESYQCMFLKTHYPLEFMVAVINNGGGFFGVEYYIHEASMCGGIIHAPHINLSEISTTISGKNIYLGFNLIKELEQKLQEEIMVERNCNSVFSSLENFMKRVSISVDQLRILIRIGAFRFTGRTKKQLLWDVHAIIGNQKKSIARKELFEGENKKYVLPELDTDEFEDARNEMKILEFPLCSPFSLVYQPLCSSLVAADLKKYVNKQVEIVGYYVTRKPTSTKKGEPMMFGCFLDKDGYFFDTNHFPEATRKFPFSGRGCYLIKGRVAEEFKFYSINVTEMYRLDYVMYEESAEEKARSRPDPVIVPPVVAASRQMEYLLVISPPPHVSNEVMLLKKNFHRQFDHYGAVVTKPHITLCNFVQSEDLEQEVLKRIALVAQKYAAFRVSLDGFDGFPYHTIFIKVLHPDLLVEMVADLKQQLKLPSKYSSFSMKPHLTIARRLDKEKFGMASAVFFEREYKTSFVSAGMILLKKDAAAKFGKYEVVREFVLEGKQKHNSNHKLNVIMNQRNTISSNANITSSPNPTLQGGATATAN